MRLKYSVDKPDVIQIKMGIKPGSTSDLGLSDDYKKEIPLTCDVTVEELPDGFDLRTVPEIIMNHAVSSIKVEVQGVYRPDKPKTRGLYEKAYDTLKKTCASVQTYTVTLRKSRERAAKSVPILDTLLKSYGVEKLANHLTSISKDIQAGGNAKETLLKWATVMEKEALEK